jgi:RNA polymerase sigma-70 factor (ECF subfamily)
MEKDIINNELITRLQNDDKEAFNELYQKYHSALYYNILKLTRDAIVTEDIVQEVFITLWEKRYDLNVEQGIAGWLFVVSYNRSISYLKRKLKESIAQTVLQQNIESTTNAGNSLENTQISILEKAIEQLSPQKRRVFELCKLQRRTYAEVADELQISKHTVKEYLSGAVISIKNYVKQYPEYSVIFFTAIYLRPLLFI